MPAAPTTLPATKDSPVPWWLWPQVLSLDAPVVIVLWQAALAHTHRIHLPAAFSWGLGLVTWFVYVLDRTADAISGRLRRPTSARHAFYFQHRKAVLGVVLPLTCLAMAWLALTQMPIGLLWQGLGLAMLGAFYLAHFSARRASPLHWLFMLLATLFGLVLIAGLPMPDPIKVLMSGTLVGVMLIAARRRFDSRWRSILPKEVPAALLIALGCAAGVHFWSPEDHSLVCIEVKLMCCLFLINLLGIASSEHMAKLHADPASLLQMQPALIGNHFWLVTAVIGWSGWVALTAILGRQAPGIAATAVVVAIGAALHGALHLFVRRLRPELYHLLADVTLIIPLPVLFWLMPN